MKLNEKKETKRKRKSNQHRTCKVFVFYRSCTKINVYARGVCNNEKLKKEEEEETTTAQI